MKYIKVNGEEHPFRRSLNALKRFDDHYKKEKITSFQPEKFGPEHLLFLIFCCIEAGYKFNDKAMPFDLERLGDLVTEADITQFAEDSETEANEEKKTQAPK